MKSLSIVTLAVLLLQSAFTLAQDTSRIRYFSEKLYVQNLIEGIRSENCGLRRSSVYMAGKYRITEVNDVLIEVMKTEKDPSTRILIALSICNIGEPSGMEAILNFSHNEKDPKAKRMFINIYQDYKNHIAAQNTF
ncbi:MAG: hypothetical protein FMNOHCHN_00670 [Ignavibacteriaceae bacterium]|nr:hypothetical protein [Ignavibacteriaceae bacterium]